MTVPRGRAGIHTVLQMPGHPHPIIAVCTGHAYPMGPFLLLSPDLRAGCRGVYRIGMNEVTIGINGPLRNAIREAAGEYT